MLWGDVELARTGRRSSLRGLLHHRGDLARGGGLAGRTAAAPFLARYRTGSEPVTMWQRRGADHPGTRPPAL